MVCGHKEVYQRTLDVASRYKQWHHHAVGGRSEYEKFFCTIVNEASIALRSGSNYG